MTFDLARILQSKRAFRQRLAARPISDGWELWGIALWRAAAPCVGIMLLLGAWSWFTPPASAPATDLSQQLEQTLLAASDQDQPADSAW